MSEQDEYTPSVDEVRHGLIAGQIALARGAVDDPDTVAIQSECGKQFDRMIEQVRREAAGEQREKDALVADSIMRKWAGTVGQVAAAEVAAAIREAGSE